MEVEIDAFRTSPPPSSVAARKVIAALTPPLAFLGAVLAGRLTENGIVFCAAFVLLFLTGAGFVFNGLRDAGRSIAVFGALVPVAFAVEFVVGLFGFLFTLGLGYAVAATLPTVFIARAFGQRRDRVLGRTPGGAVGPWGVWVPPPGGHPPPPGWYQQPPPGGYQQPPPGGYQQPPPGYPQPPPGWYPPPPPGSEYPPTPPQ
jgi:hypothetical protein